MQEAPLLGKLAHLVPACKRKVGCLALAQAHVGSGKVQRGTVDVCEVVVRVSRVVVAIGPKQLERAAREVEPHFFARLANGSIAGGLPGAHAAARHLPPACRPRLVKRAARDKHATLGVAHHYDGIQHVLALPQAL